MPSCDRSFSIRSSIAPRAAADSAGGAAPGVTGPPEGEVAGAGIEAVLGAGCARLMAGASKSTKTILHGIVGENISILGFVSVRDRASRRNRNLAGLRASRRRNPTPPDAIRHIRRRASRLNPIPPDAIRRIRDRASRRANAPLHPTPSARVPTRRQGPCGDGQNQRRRPRGSRSRR